MSRFLKSTHAALTPYTPGEQIKDGVILKLNTNESPFPPSVRARERAAAALASLQLYQHPEGLDLRQKMAERLQLRQEEILLGNGSDDILNLVFMAFFDDQTKLHIPDISYGFYKVYCGLYHVPYVEIPLREDLKISCEDYFHVDGPILFANPNAPTGWALTHAEIEKILLANPEQLVIVDEAYVDFGGESVVDLVHTYPNLLVTQTFSKSRSLAGGRLGMAFGNEEIIRDLTTMKYSTNPYNVNAMTLAAGIGAWEDVEYFQNNCEAIEESRAYLAEEVGKLGFAFPDSKANFLFMRHSAVAGNVLYNKLKKRGILVRYFPKPRIEQYIRVTIGRKEDMKILVQALEEILEETR